MYAALDTAQPSTPAAQPAARGPAIAAPARAAWNPADAAAACERITRQLRLLQDRVPIQRRVLHAGDRLYEAGQGFAALHVLHSGCFKTVNVAADGREQVVGLHFKGDWLGFDGIAHGRYGCDAVAMDTGEVWSLSYDALLRAAAAEPALLAALHDAMSREITRDRDSLLSLCTLSADARVADFLRYWAESLARRGLRCDLITLRMTRAEIGNYLGMTLETASRALSRLAAEGLIRFADKSRRELLIPDPGRLAAFVEDGVPLSRKAAPLLQ